MKASKKWCLHKKVKFYLHPIGTCAMGIVCWLFHLISGSCFRKIAFLVAQCTSSSVMPEHWADRQTDRPSTTTLAAYALMNMHATHWPQVPSHRERVGQGTTNCSSISECNVIIIVINMSCLNHPHATW